MVEAAQTTASPAAIWVMCVVMTVLAGFMVSGVLVADSSQARASRRARLARGLGAASDGAWVGGSVPGDQAAEIPGEAEIPEEAGHEPIGAQGRHARDESIPQGEAPTRADLPAQETPGRHAMPAQRAGDADRAARSYSGPGTPDDEEPGR
jgi:hypothetical protein